MNSFKTFVVAPSLFLLVSFSQVVFDIFGLHCEYPCTYSYFLFYALLLPGTSLPPNGSMNGVVTRRKQTARLPR